MNPSTSSKLASPSSESHTTYRLNTKIKEAADRVRASYDFPSINREDELRRLLDLVRLLP